MGKKEQKCEEIFYLRKTLTKMNGFEWKDKQKTKLQKKNGEKSLNFLFWQRMLKGRACMHNNSVKSSNHSLESQISFY